MGIFLLMENFRREIRYLGKEKKYEDILFASSIYRDAK